MRVFLAKLKYYNSNTANYILTKSTGNEVIRLTESLLTEWMLSFRQTLSAEARYGFKRNVLRWS